MLYGTDYYFIMNFIFPSSRSCVFFPMHNIVVITTAVGREQSYPLLQNQRGTGFEAAYTARYMKDAV